MLDLLLNLSNWLLIEIPFILAIVFLIKYSKLCDSCLDGVNLEITFFILAVTNTFYLYNYLSKVGFVRYKIKSLSTGDTDCND
jgi:hypothetical protein